MLDYILDLIVQNLLLLIEGTAIMLAAFVVVMVVIHWVEKFSDDHTR